MDRGAQNRDFRLLHQFILDSAEIKALLDGITGHAAAFLSLAADVPVACAVTLKQRERAFTIAGSSRQAVLLDRIEQDLDQGPSQEALRSQSVVLLADTASDRRWPQYSARLAAAGNHSALAAPINLGSAASASLNFFAPATGVFTKATAVQAVAFTRIAGLALGLTQRVAAAERLAEELRSALDSRTEIDLACGMIMAQNHCSQEQAYQFLIRASNNQNMKLHTVAQKIIERLSGDKKTATHFEA